MSDKPKVIATHHIPVEQLNVIAYVDVNGCTVHPDWALLTIPVTDCLYFRCVQSGDEKFYQQYIELWKRRKDSPYWKDYPYSKFQDLIAEIKGAGGFSAVKAARYPMQIYRGTRALKDGHHRAAVFAHFFPGVVVPVEEVDAPLPDDVNVCGTPCYTGAP